MVFYVAEFAAFRGDRRRGIRSGCRCGREGHDTVAGADRCSDRQYQRPDRSGANSAGLVVMRGDGAPLTDADDEL